MADNGSEELERLRDLETEVRGYISELANPAPCWVMRMQLRKNMAALVGLPDPAETRKKLEGKR